MDGWCSETKTAYQFHGCFFHGCPCTRKEVNSVNGKPMTQLLNETRKTTAYLCHFVKVVEMWECESKEMRRDPVVKRCLDAAFPRRRRHVRWTMTTQQILSGVRTGTVFGMIECDIRVPEELREYFAEMQPVFKNIRLIREDLGPFMRQYAETHNIMTIPRRMLVGSYYGDKILLATPLLRWYLDHGLEVLHIYKVIEYDSVFPSVRRCCIQGPSRGRRPHRQDHHRGHHEVAGELGLRKDHHQRGPTSRCQLLHGEGGIASDQQ